ncbi:MAG: cyclic nucleotide-binding protein [Rhodanobacter denitrificans]|uniref:Cyclic nucleotide-binding protein n=1 Tax=Rhodanobacter denitrificans TaxID=666685 RepID=A0A2W5KHC7_9GAMM|nr:MAG: cyclic nucleotide-binding protein [Rhodanobacter denitrificans]
MNPASAFARIDPRQTARKLLQTELDSLPADEREVIERFIARRSVSRNIVRELDRSRGLGERVADRVAAVGGSWPFIIGFLVLLFAWMGYNTFVLAREAFDPYPYILLNLVLSCLAAIQAPIIMMSQNRQAAADRLGAQHDYEVNVKSELEIMQVHEKLNALRERDWAVLVELQNRQIQMLQRLLERQAGVGDGGSASNPERQDRESP